MRQRITRCMAHMQLQLVETQENTSQAFTGELPAKQALANTQINAVRCLPVFSSMAIGANSSMLQRVNAHFLQDVYCSSLAQDLEHDPNHVIRQRWKPLECQTSLQLQNILKNSTHKTQLKLSYAQLVHWQIGKATYSWTVRLWPLRPGNTKFGFAISCKQSYGKCHSHKNIELADTSWFDAQIKYTHSNKD